MHRLQVAFEAFSCFVFENGSGFLVTDVAIQCYTPAHEKAKAVASLAIAIYPIGLLVLNAFLLFRTRRAITQGTPTKLSEAIRFLHRDYKPQVSAPNPVCLDAAEKFTSIACVCRAAGQYFWWELMEMGRRLLLVGIFIIWPFSQGNVMQVAIANVTAILFQVCCMCSSHALHAQQHIA